MNLIVCPSKVLAVYMLAYIQEYGKGGSFHIVVNGVKTFPTEMVTLANRLDSKFIQEEDLFNFSYEELIIHSYFKF